MKKILIIITMIFSLIFLTACSQTVEEVKHEKNIGEIVSVSGTVKGTLKIGELTAYTLVDKNGDSIGVASKELPTEGDKVIAKGELKKVPILGYYIDINK